MNKTEVAKFLTIASGFDRREVDELTVTSWHQVPEVSAARYDDAVKVVIAHQTSAQSTEYFAVRHLVNGIRLMQRTASADVEADVRSAKARGLVDRNWPRAEPLPADVAQKLHAARERDRNEALRLGNELAR